MSGENSKKWKLNSRDVASTVANTTVHAGALVAASVVMEQFADSGIENIQTEGGMLTFVGSVMFFTVLKMLANAIRDKDNDKLRNHLSKIASFIWKFVTYLIGLVGSREKTNDGSDSEPATPKEGFLKRLIKRDKR